MKGGECIIDVRDSIIRSSEESILRIRTQFRKRREKWLVILGLILHAVYMLSIYDVYFKSPIVRGMEPIKARFSAPAKRLVLLVADGLRADKFFEPDSDGNYRAPFLRSVVKERGRWGVSHGHPIMESRRGHVAIIAGFYEDPSAVTKGRKANPVEFDSVFNRSRHTFAFGSPDIVPMFCGALQHSTWNSYLLDFEDLATDASFLDEWSLDQLQSLLNRSNEDANLKQLLQQDNLVVFLHLPGCGSNCHTHGPNSSVYLNNVKVADHVAERVYNIIENYFKDNLTAYVFTADHGMSDKGSHGDRHPPNTDTPLIVWGAGVGQPVPISRKSYHHDESVRFIDEYVHDTPKPPKWGLDGLQRLDVNQADIAPLMSTLLGLPCPINSVGNLPLGYLNFSEVDKVEAVLANTKQILNQFLRKSQLKQSSWVQFKPFKPLANYMLVLDQIEHLISIKDYEAAKKLTKNLRSLALEGLHYVPTCDWHMLMTVVSLGYLGWMICLTVHVLQSYTAFTGKLFRKDQKKSTGKVYFSGLVSESNSKEGKDYNVEDQVNAQNVDGSPQETKGTSQSNMENGFGAPQAAKCEGRKGVTKQAEPGVRAPVFSRSVNESNSKEDKDCRIEHQANARNVDGSPQEIKGTSQSSMENRSGSPQAATSEGRKEVIEQFAPGVYVVITLLANGTKIFKRIRFSKKRFSEVEAEEWFKENKDRVLKKYSPVENND